MIKEKKPKSRFKKPVNVNKTIFNTLKIILTAGFGAIITMAVYFIITKGWEAFLAWWTGKWFALIAVVIIFAAVIVIWLITIIQSIRKVTENE